MTTAAVRVFCFITSHSTFLLPNRRTLFETLAGNWVIMSLLAPYYRLLAQLVYLTYCISSEVKFA